MDLSQIDVDEETVKTVASLLITKVLPIVAPGATVIPLAIEVLIPIARTIIRVAKADHFTDEELDALNAVINEQSALIQKDPDVEGAPV